MKNYTLTIKELLENVQDALDGLKGKNAVKEGGISKMTKTALSGMKIDLSDYLIDIVGCELEMFCASLNRTIKFAEIRVAYRPDKRRWDGKGDFLAEIKIRLTKDIPMELEVINASQWLDYNEARDNFERLEREQRELLEIYKNNMTAMEKMQDIMKYQAYDNITTKIAEEANETLRGLRLR